jgi:putative hydrolase of the HAD superfamily
MEVNSEVFNENKELFDEYECGLTSSETFLWRFQYISNKVPPASALIKAWNAMILGWNPEKILFIESISKKYNTFLLSNTNELHLQYVYKDLIKNHGITDFDTRFFKKTYYSHKLKMRKPNKDIFQFVLQDAQLNASDTVFIDDLVDNIQTAKELGMHTIHHATNAPLTEEYILSNISSR